MGRRAKKKAARGTKRAKARERDTVSVRGVRMGLVVKWMKAHTLPCLGFRETPK